MKSESPPLEPVPLQVITPRKQHEPSDRRQVGSTSSPGFQVPDGWLVEEKPRTHSPSCPGRVDRFYVEPGTGKKFRSLPEVRRYLMDGKTDMPTIEVSEEAGDKSDMQIIPLKNWSTSGFVLPDGWRIEEKRRSGGVYPGMVDKYYIEPKTGTKFRSLAAVKRYLMDEKTDMSTPEVSQEAGDKSDMQITPLTNWSTSDFVLPDGWRIEEKQRSSGASHGVVDKYYIEPKTRKKFRSLAAVKRYLIDGKTEKSTPRVSKEAGDKCNMQIITTSPSDFVLPDGWRIEGKRRDTGVNPGKLDKFYIEPGTGKKFGSANAVKRHLNLSDGSTDTSTPKALKQGSDKRAMQIAPFTSGKTSNFVLPDGWIIEKKKRHYTVHKYYVEQATGQRFRSLLAVERYLKEQEENEDAMPLKAFKRPNGHDLSCRSGSRSTNVSGNKCSPKVASQCPTNSEEITTMPKVVTPDCDPTSSERSDTLEKSNSGEKAEASMDDFAFPPSTINWVLAGPGGDMWSPFVDDLMVPEPVKQKWSETFISSLHDDSLS
ncbi:hypothetical protein TIFTF001_000508 [Ficus carica]|uniref:MBD domain-containing protein n=1 Tax=Ficus carica TaxID=3494 RepID=A0AA87ZDP8_FICCA|nr:hypothetical protein TIFTF001_000508 [Ficus carica]